MSSLIKRSITLSFSRISNSVILLLGPLILVRILDIEEFGKYREFILYATLIGSIIGFSIKGNLIYFSSKYPEHNNLYITQTILLQFISASIGLAIVYAGRDLVFSLTNYEFGEMLIIYLFFFITLDYIESYWLANKRSDYVLYYSSARLLIRLGIVVITAYNTHDALAIIRALIIVEILRFSIMLFITIKKKYLVAKINIDSLKEQLTYIIPLGVATIASILNRDIGKLFISTNLGVSALAFYVVGTYMMPIVHVTRSAISEVIFPDIVRNNRKNNTEMSLSLWQRTTIIYCFLLFPVAFILLFYSKIIIITLFTEAYVDGVPIFIIYTFILVRECFDFHLPLRVINKNVYYLTANILALIINVIMMFVFYNWLGLIGPAIAFVLSDLIMAIYMGIQVEKLFKIRLTEMFSWRQIGKILFACVISIPVVYLGEYVEMNEAIRGLLFSSIYIAFYIFVILRLNIQDVNLLFIRLLRK